MIVTPTTVPQPPMKNHTLGQVDTAKLQSNIMELDTNKDGQISDGEFTAYRNQKQAAGQFTPLEGPIGGPIGERIQQTMFEALLTRQE